MSIAHIHTKQANADKIAALITSVQRAAVSAKEPNPAFGLNVNELKSMKYHQLKALIDDLAALANEAELALIELKDQTGIE